MKASTKVLCILLVLAALMTLAAIEVDLLGSDVYWVIVIVCASAYLVLMMLMAAWEEEGD